MRDHTISGSGYPKRGKKKTPSFTLPPPPGVPGTIKSFMRNQTPETTGISEQLEAHTPAPELQSTAVSFAVAPPLCRRHVLPIHHEQGTGLGAKTHHLP